MFAGVIAIMIARSLDVPQPPPPEPIGSFVHGPAPLTPTGPYYVVMETDYPHYCQIVGPGVSGTWPCEFADLGAALANTVWRAQPERRCDFNGDGVVNSQDFFEFVTAFTSTEPTP